MFVPQLLQHLRYCLSSRRSSKGRNVRRRPPAHHRVQLCLEGLEERLTPSVVNPIGNDSPAVVGQVNPAAAAATTTTANDATATFSSSAQNVTLTATVISSGTPVTTGTVTFTVLQGTRVIGTATPGTFSSGSWSASYSLPANTSSGVYIIDAAYHDGTGAFEDSFDATHTLTVSSTTAVATKTTASPVSANFNTSAQNLTLSATVAPSSGSGTVDAGSVQFTIRQGNTPIGTAVTGTVNSSGQASATYSLPGGTSAGSYTIEADYFDPTGAFDISSDAAQKLTVTASTATKATSANAAFSSSDQNVTLTAAVTSSAGTVSEGNVTFTIVDSNGNTIGTAIPSAVINGQASVSFVVPGGTAAGSYVILADYSDSGGSFDSSHDHTQTLTISSASATTLRLTTVNIVPSLSNSTAQLTLTVQVNNAAGTVNEGVVSITLAGVPGHGNVVHGSASVQLSVSLSAVSNLATVDLSYTDKAASANFADAAVSATVTTNLLNSLLPANLTFDSSGNVQNQLSLGGNTSLLGFSYLSSGLLTNVLFDSLSLPVTYSNVSGNTVTTFLGSPTAVTFVGPNGQAVGKAEVFFDGAQLQWLIYDPNNHPIGEVPYTGLI